MRKQLLAKVLFVRPVRTTGEPYVEFGNKQLMLMCGLYRSSSAIDIEIYKYILD